MVLYAWAPDTESGTARCTVEPSPSSPSAFLPQQNAVPAPLSAHVWELVAPAVSEATPVRPVTSVGVNTRSGGRPSWLELLLPQQYGRSFGVRAHVWSYPAEMVRKLKPPVTALGPNC